jgi:tetratricopeptide (TPR) repeat protein
VLIKKYPNNKDFYDWCVRILLSLDRLNEAEELINNDKNNAVTGYSKSSFLIKIGEYKQAVSLLNELIDKKDFKWGGAYKHAKLMRAISSLLIDEPIPGVEKELDEAQLIIYSEIKNNLPAAKKVYEFATKVGRLNTGVKMEIPQIDDLPERGYLRSMYDFYTGVYYERYRDGTNAVRVFHNVAEDRSHFSSQSVEYLIQIYKSFKPTEEQLDELEDVIDDLEDEDLEFSFMDLRK